MVVQFRDSGGGRRRAIFFQPLRFSRAYTHVRIEEGCVLRPPSTPCFFFFSSQQWGMSNSLCIRFVWLVFTRVLYVEFFEVHSLVASLLSSVVFDPMALELCRAASRQSEKILDNWFLKLRPLLDAYNVRALLISKSVAEEGRGAHRTTPLSLLPGFYGDTCRLMPPCFASRCARACTCIRVCLLDSTLH